MSESAAHVDHRNFPRLAKDATVEIAKLEYPIKKSSDNTGALVNIAQEGICCAVATAYKVGTVVNLKISLKGFVRHREGVRAMLDVGAAKSPLTVIGEVVWCKPSDTGYEIGVHLTNIYEDDRKALSRYLGEML